MAADEPAQGGRDLHPREAARYSPHRADDLAGDATGQHSAPEGIRSRMTALRSRGERAARRAAAAWHSTMPAMSGMLETTVARLDKFMDDGNVTLDRLADILESLDVPMLDLCPRQHRFDNVLHRSPPTSPVSQHSKIEEDFQALVKQALSTITSSGEQDPRAAIHYRNGLILAMAGQHKEALREYKLANDENPDCQTYCLMGISLELLGRRREARKAYEKALSITPGFDMALVRLRALKARRENPGEGLRCLRPFFTPSVARAPTAHERLNETPAAYRACCCRFLRGNTLLCRAKLMWRAIISLLLILQLGDLGLFAQVDLPTRVLLATASLVAWCVRLNVYYRVSGTLVALAGRIMESCRTACLACCYRLARVSRSLTLRARGHA